MMLTVLMLLAACGSTTKATERVATSLRDPSSVQFRNVKRGADGLVCGEVNEKNAYGGYVGFVPFMVSDTAVIIASAEHPIMPSRWVLTCRASELVSQAQRDSFVRNLRAEDSLNVLLEKGRAELDRLNKSIDALRAR